MELFDIISPVESRLASICQRNKIPMGGSMELLPLCNMRCKMCYIRQDPDEMKKIGRMLTLEEWIRIAKEAKEAGVVSLLLTGGEPFLYPDFRSLYHTLTDMGFVITMNTNATLIDENLAGFLAERPCRRLNITLYGKDDATYERLCGNPKGFTQVMRATDLLNKYKIPFRFQCTVTPENMDQIDDLYAIAKEKNTILVVNSHIFPPIRCINETFQRISPKEEALSNLKAYRINNPHMTDQDLAKNILHKITQPNRSCMAEGLGCMAGLCGFWISWNGDLLPCGMFEEPKISLLDHSFQESWDYIVAEVAKLHMYEGCYSCDKRNICTVCAAGCLTENHGDMSKKPNYICESTEHYYRLLKEMEKSN